MSKFSVWDIVRPFDRGFSDFLKRSGATEQVCEAGMITSWAISQGHVAVDLSTISSKDLWPNEDESELPDISTILSNLSSPLLGDGEAPSPLVLRNSKLYIYRYFIYETVVVDWVRRRLGGRSYQLSEKLKSTLNSMISQSNGGADPHQISAVLSPLFSSFSILSGGPGTGKTTTVAKMLSLLCTERPDIRIALCAPTGKATQRMNESLMQSFLSDSFKAVDKDVLENLKQLKATTIHRLLGSRFLSSKFRHNRRDPVPYDLVVVDESSMIDLPMMAKLMDAISEETDLILLGDKDQLASVEVGSVFGDFCKAFPENSFSSQFLDLLEEFGVRSLDFNSSSKQSPLILFKKSYRFNSSSGVGRVATAIHRGEDPSTVDCEGEVSIDESLKNIDLYSYSSDLMGARSEVEALSLLGRGIILTARNEGSFGQLKINRDILNHWSNGAERCNNMPIMITENNYGLHLFNGDMGIVRRKENRWYAFFQSGDSDGVRSLPLEILPPWQLAFAITIHKSQGSEYNRVAILLGDQPSITLTRELLYTAVTRVKPDSSDRRVAVAIQADKALLNVVLGQTVERYSGIADRLRGI